VEPNAIVVFWTSAVWLEPLWILVLTAAVCFWNVLLNVQVTVWSGVALNELGVPLVQVELVSVQPGGDVSVSECGFVVVSIGMMLLVLLPFDV
jgi:hypothetical protein